MKFVKAKRLYDGVTSKQDIFVGFDGDRIAYVGSEKPEGEDLGEGFVTPAFIDSHSHIGMDRAGEPYHESEANEKLQALLPLARAIDSVYMDDDAFTGSVESGILYSTVLPGSGNIIGGMGSLVRNYAGNVNEAFVQDIGVKMALGYNPRSTTEWKGDRPSTRMGAAAMLREQLLQAQKADRLVKSGKKSLDEIDSKTEMFMKILSGELKIMCHLHREDDAIQLLNLADKFGIKPIINHGLDFYRPEIFSLIREKGISIVYGPLDAHPYKVELKHETWKNCKLLYESGVKFSLMSDHPVILQRNLFLTVRHFMRFGASREECISYLTSRPAEILGLKDLGVIENGNKASLTLWNGDPFSLESYPVRVIGEGKLLVDNY